jgi:hypothetical protein
MWNDAHRQSISKQFGLRLLLFTLKKFCSKQIIFSCSFPEIHNRITKYINFPGYIPNLTSVKDNLKIYNKLMFFKTNTKNVIQYSCAVTFHVFGLFCSTRLTSRASKFGLIAEKSSDSTTYMKITILCLGKDEIHLAKNRGNKTNIFDNFSTS